MKWRKMTWTLAGMLWLSAEAQTDLTFIKHMYVAGEYEKAVPQLSELLTSTDLKNGEAYKLRADCFQKMGENGMAREDYDRARLYGYDLDDLYLNRGICKTSLSMFEDARQDLIVYVEKNQEDARGYYWMANLEYMNMDNKSCLRYVDEALFLDSTYADAYYLRGAVYVEQGKMNFAFEDFEMAYSLDPHLFRAKLNIAVLLLDAGQYQNALELLVELKTEPIDFIGELLYYSGEALYMLHDMEGACDEWREAASLGDKDAENNFKKICLDKSGKVRFKRRNYAQF